MEREHRGVGEVAVRELYVLAYAREVWEKLVYKPQLAPPL